jgi:ATP-dependent helicase IRC3
MLPTALSCFLELNSTRLSKLAFTTVRAQIDLSRVTINTRTGDFTPSSLAHVINTEVVNNLVVKTWMDRASKLRKFYPYFG